MGKVVRTIILMVVSLLISVGCTYWIQCYIFEKNLKTIDPTSVTIARLMLFAVPVLACQIVFLVLNAITKWYKGKGASLFIMINTMLFIVLMLFVFPRIPVKYELIPVGEMAFGAMQLLAQVISCIPAALCGFIAGIVFLTKKVSGRK